MNKNKYPHVMAMRVAKELQDMLAPACERIAIVGSIRRGKALVSDLELLYQPRYSKRPDGLFDEKIVDVASEVCEKLLKDGVLAKRQNVNGQYAWGESNKYAIHVATGIPVDLFSIGSNPDRWWVSLVIRTGSKETNLKLTTGANKKNASLLAFGTGVKWSDGTVTQCNSEEDVFVHCSVPYLEPKDR